MKTGLIKVGKDIPEFTPVEIATSTELFAGEVYEMSVTEAGTSNPL